MKAHLLFKSGYWTYINDEWFWSKKDESKNYTALGIKPFVGYHVPGIEPWYVTVDKSGSNTFFTVSSIFNFFGNTREIIINRPDPKEDPRFSKPTAITLPKNISIDASKLTASNCNCGNEGGHWMYCPYYTPTYELWNNITTRTFSLNAAKENNQSDKLLNETKRAIKIDGFTYAIDPGLKDQTAYFLSQNKTKPIVLKFEHGFYYNNCECGSESVGGLNHSNWCPKYE